MPLPSRNDYVHPAKRLLSKFTEGEDDNSVSETYDQDLIYYHLIRTLLAMCSPKTVAAYSPGMSPDSAFLCGRAMAHALHHIPKDANKVLSAVEVQLLDTLMAFVSIERSQEDLTALDTFLGSCVCNLAEPALEHLHAAYDCVDQDERGVKHDERLQRQPGLARVTACLFSSLCGILEQLDKEKLASATIRTKTRTLLSRWPNTTQSLLPLGPASVMRSAKAWFTFTSEPRVLKFAGCIFDLFPSFILKGFFQGNSNLFQSAIEHLIQLPDAIQRELMFENLPRHSWLIRNVEETVHFLQRFASQGPKVRDAVFALSSRNDYELCTAVRRLAAVLPSVKDGEDVIECARRFGYTFENGPHGRPHLPLYLNHAHHATSGSPCDPYNAFDKLLSVFLNDASCAAPGCLRSTNDGLPFVGVCAGCRVLRYCSRECQRESWNNHRKICKDLGAYRELKKGMKELGYFKGECSCDMSQKLLSQLKSDLRVDHVDNGRLEALGEELETLFYEKDGLKAASLLGC